MPATERLNVMHLQQVYSLHFTPFSTFYISYYAVKKLPVIITPFLFHCIWMLSKYLYVSPPVNEGRHLILPAIRIACKSC